jgi:hypothetical protein
VLVLVGAGLRLLLGEVGVEVEVEVGDARG